MGWFTLVELGVIIPELCSLSHSWTKSFFLKAGVIGVTKSVIRTFNTIFILALEFDCYIKTRLIKKNVRTIEHDKYGLI